MQILRFQRLRKRKIPCRIHGRDQGRDFGPAGADVVPRCRFSSRVPLPRRRPGRRAWSWGCSPAIDRNGLSRSSRSARGCEASRRAREAAIGGTPDPGETRCRASSIPIARRARRQGEPHHDHEGQQSRGTGVRENGAEGDADPEQGGRDPSDVGDGCRAGIRLGVLVRGHVFGGCAPIPTAPRRRSELQSDPDFVMRILVVVSG